MTFHSLPIAGIVILSLVTVTTLLLMMFGIINYKTQRDRQREKLRYELSVKTDQLSTGIALSAWNIDKPQIDRIMESMMQDSATYGVVVRITVEGAIVHARVRDTRFPVETLFLFDQDVIQVPGGNINAHLMQLLK